MSAMYTLILLIGSLFILLIWATYIVADVREQRRKEHPPLTGLSDDDHAWRDI